MPYQASTLLLTAGKTYRDIGNPQNAKKVLLEAIKYIDEQKSPCPSKNNKFEFDVYNTLIHVFLISKEQKHAEEYFSIAINKAASLPEKERYKYSGLLYRDMTFNCIENGLLALTIKYAQQAIRTQKDKAAAYDMAEINLSLARAYYWENDCARTLKLCQNAENLIKQVSGTDKQLLLTKRYIQYANTYQRNKQYSQAITKYRQAIKLHGDRFSDEYPFPRILYTSLAICYQNLKEYAESEKLLKKALWLAKNDYQTATAYFVLGRLYMGMKKFDKSVKAFDYSLSAFDTTKNIYNSYKAKAYWGKARALHAQKNYTAAVKNANQALQFSKKSSPLYKSIKSKIADWQVNHP